MNNLADEDTDRIAILNNCNCLVCNKHIEKPTRLRKSRNYPGLTETHLNLTHPRCERVYKRMLAAKNKIERAELDVINLEFAIFMLSSF